MNLVHKSFLFFQRICIILANITARDIRLLKCKKLLISTTGSITKATSEKEIPLAVVG